MVAKYRFAEPTRYACKRGTLNVAGTGADSISEGVTLGSNYAQRIISSGNPYHLLGRSNRNIGGAFLSMRVDVQAGMDSLSLSQKPPGASSNQFYEGPVLPHFELWDAMKAPKNSVAYVTSRCPVEVANDQLDAYGATAIAQSSPTNPAFDASTAIGELLTGIPTVPGRQLRSSVRDRTGGYTTKVAEEHLNLVFGVIPTVSDMRKFHQTATAVEAELQRADTRMDGWRRRQHRDTMHDVDDKQVVPMSDGLLQGPGGVVPVTQVQRLGSRTKSTSRTKQTWFKGAFKYPHPPKGTWSSKLRELDRKYGIVPDYETAWNLFPFSWLIDWNSNLGDVIHNLNAWALEGVVLKYGYVMCHQTVTTTYTLDNEICVGGVWRPHSSVASLRYETKQRRSANPFGFGVDGGSYSPRQLAILASLGLTLR